MLMPSKCFVIFTLMKNTLRSPHHLHFISNLPDFLFFFSEGKMSSDLRTKGKHLFHGDYSELKVGLILAPFFLSKQIVRRDFMWTDMYTSLLYPVSALFGKIILSYDNRPICITGFTWTENMFQQCGLLTIQWVGALQREDTDEPV